MVHTTRRTHTPDLPAYHRQQLLRDMDLPSAKDAAREAALLPLYLYTRHDLPRAGIIFRAPYLRFLIPGCFFGLITSLRSFGPKARRGPQGHSIAMEPLPYHRS